MSNVFPLFLEKKLAGESKLDIGRRTPLFHESQKAVTPESKPIPKVKAAVNTEATYMPTNHQASVEYMGT